MPTELLDEIVPVLVNVVIVPVARLLTPLAFMPLAEIVPVLLNVVSMLRFEMT